MYVVDLQPRTLARIQRPLMRPFLPFQTPLHSPSFMMPEISIESQYNDLGSDYDLLNSLPSSRLEIDNLHRIVTSLLPKSTPPQPLKALDLACGTGRFTRLLLDWGFTSVLGVDISAGMIDVAKATTDPTLLRSGKIDFLVADGSVPQRYATDSRGGDGDGEGVGEGGGPHDFALGCWFHACASNREQMANMWRTVALNLKPGGYFVGTTPMPSEDPKANSLRIEKVRPMWKGNVNHVFLREIEDGIVERIVFLPLPGTKADEKGEKMELETYCLRKGVWEDGARGAGFEISWRMPEIRGRLLRVVGARRMRREFGRV